jgi:hypothetical protein
MGGPSHNTGEKLRGRFVLSDAPRASSNTPGLVGDYTPATRQPGAILDFCSLNFLPAQTGYQYVPSERPDAVRQNPKARCG